MGCVKCPQLPRDYGCNRVGKPISLPINIYVHGFLLLLALVAAAMIIVPVVHAKTGGLTFAAGSLWEGASAPSPRPRDDYWPIWPLIFSSLLVQVRLRLALRDVLSQRGGAIPRCLLPSNPYQHLNPTLS